MNENERREILVVIQQSEPDVRRPIEQTVQIPQGAGLTELLREIERESPEIYPEIRGRVLRAAGGVLATGQEHPLLEGLTRQLAAGGPVVFPAVAEDTRDASAVV